jgi:hypothetical protein
VLTAPLALGSCGAEDDADTTQDAPVRQVGRTLTLTAGDNPETLQLVSPDGTSAAYTLVGGP